MNTKYERGNVISSAAQIDEYKFPAKMPTEEWAGNEVRSYQNYIRPIGNLFENDRELNAISEGVYKALAKSGSNGIISGCEVKKITVGSYPSDATYYEIDNGIFVHGNKIYSIFPKCEAVSKQISIDKGERYSFHYDESLSNPFTCNWGINLSSSASAATAVELINGIDSNILGEAVIVPIIQKTESESNVLVFDGTGLVFKESALNTDTIIATVNGNTITPGPFAKLNGSRFDDNTIPSTAINGNFITIGTTNVELGSTSAIFNGIDSINGVETKTDSDNGLNIESSHGSITAKSNYELGDACAKAVDANTFSSDDNLPTERAIKGYFGLSKTDSKITHANEEVFSSAASFASSVKVSGKATFNGEAIFSSAASFASSATITVNNSNNATINGQDISAPIYSKGGIAAEKDIISKANIIGKNVGTFSKRSLKENIKKFDTNAVDLLNEAEIVSFNYISDKDKNFRIGFIADDTHEYMSGSNHDMMDQSNCIGLLIKSVQELAAENKKLKEEIDGLYAFIRNK